MHGSYWHERVRDVPTDNMTDCFEKDLVIVYLHSPIVFVSKTEMMCQVAPGFNLTDGILALQARCVGQGGLRSFRLVPVLNSP